MAKPRRWLVRLDVDCGMGGEYGLVRAEHKPRKPQRGWGWCKRVEFFCTADSTLLAFVLPQALLLPPGGGPVELPNE
jgi:hypothetical protein